jgi:hypothetical protein
MSSESFLSYLHSKSEEVLWGFLDRLEARDGGTQEGGKPELVWKVVNTVASVGRDKLKQVKTHYPFMSL